MITLAAEYAKERVQFGKPIGSYQAIKHHLASVQVKLEFARPVVYAAVTRAADLDPRAAATASHAKLAAGDAAELAARTAIQVHGAMGYSWELDLHFYMKRAWALQGAWGDRSFHARRVQSLVCGGALALGPDQTFARTA
jgi:alkylation response protein AidB-like acyl-CoA dehydrogenase